MLLEHFFYFLLSPYAHSCALCPSFTTPYARYCILHLTPHPVKSCTLRLYGANGDEWLMLTLATSPSHLLVRGLDATPSPGIQKLA
jgi:hypothetical protein